MIKNGTIIEINSINFENCIGQICGSKETFMGIFYDILILKSEIWQRGEITRAAAEFITPLNNPEIIKSL